MNKIHLIGEIADVCGVTVLEAEVKDLYDVLQCLRVNFKAFEGYLFNAAKEGMQYTIQYGEYFLGEDELDHLIGKRDVVISPVVSGSGAEGKIIGGIALIALGAFTGGVGFIAGSTLIMAGIALTLNGFLDIITPSQENLDDESEKSSLFSSAENTMKEGNIRPITHGRCWCGSQVLSFSVRTFNTFEEEDE